MFQVRIHGRGGQGVVTAAEMLSVAAFREGRHAQAFPSFGSERTGAPVVAFCRIDDKEIRLREPVMEPDALIIQDPTLLHQVDVFAGLAPRRLHPDQYDAHLRRARARRVRRAASIASASARCPRPISRCKHVGRPLPNAALLGGFAAVSGRIIARLGRRGDPREIRRQGRRGQRRRRRASLRVRAQRKPEAAHA